MVSEALKKLITDNIDKIYLANIDLRVATVLEIISHLKERYYKISTAEIGRNDKEFRKPWDPEEPIESYFERMRLCVELAEDAINADNITETTQIQVMFGSMEMIDEFKQQRREWKRKSREDKTIENFRLHFVEAYEDMLEDRDRSEDPQEAHNVLSSDILEALLNPQETKNEHAMNIYEQNLTNSELIKLVRRLEKKVEELQINGQRGGQNANDGGRNGKSNGPTSWRRVPPADGAPTEKTVDNQLFKFCAKCRQGRGLWTTGQGLHGTEQHDPSKRKRS